MCQNADSLNLPRDEDQLSFSAWRAMVRMVQCASLIAYGTAFSEGLLMADSGRPARRLPRSETCPPLPVVTASLLAETLVQVSSAVGYDRCCMRRCV
jgi:hypothetical protein